ncbi:MAG: stage V sporulation protein AD [Oscillospiraceae bacterium]
MAYKIGKRTMGFNINPSIKAFASIVGKKEMEGPLRDYFDIVNKDTTFGEKTWEKAESKMQELVVQKVLDKANLQPCDIDYIFAGDLLNQCIASSFNIRQLDIPFVGLYGACSTMAESLCMASVFIDNGSSNYCIALTSSHFCTAERQFRLPLEYGSQRTPTSQWTATGSGSTILSKTGDGPYIKSITIGKIRDLGIKDANNMGAAMAPSAADTIKAFLDDTKTKPQNYDLIITGDLGLVGSALLIDLLKRDGYDISSLHKDCGLLIYDTKRQDVHAGGSGCGCAGSVLNSYILKNMVDKKINNILFIATGALLSPVSTQQGESIPSISHLLHISNSIEGA